MAISQVDLTFQVKGVLPAANGGNGVNGGAAPNGNLAIGNGSGFTLNPLTAGTGITVTNGAGTITVANSAPSPTFVDSETPSGTIDGVNKVFTLANPPSPAGSLILVMAPTAGVGHGQLQGIDYTLASATITYTTAPPAGANHRAWYRR